MSDTPSNPAPAENPTPEATQKPEANPAPAPKKYKVKVDNAELEVDESELLRGYSRNQAATKRFEEGARLRKEAEELLSMPKKDMRAFLKAQGLNPQEVAEALLIAEMEEALITPEMREQMEKDQKLKAYEEKEREEKTKKEQAEEEARVEEARQVFDTKIRDALEGTGLSRDAYTVRSAALFVRSCLKQGFEPDADEIREAVTGRVKNDYKAQVQGRKGQELIEWLGEDVVNEIRRFDLQRLRGSKQPPEIPKAPAAPQEQQKPREDKWAIEQRVKKWAES